MFIQGARDLDFLRSLHLDGIVRKAGTAILVCPLGEIDANAFVRFLLLARGLPEQVLLVRAHVEYVPHLPVAERAELTALGHGVQLVDIRYGFDDDPDVPQVLRCIDRLRWDPAAARYYVIDDRTAARFVRGWPAWRKRLFAFLSAACVPAGEYFRLPPHCTTEIQAYGTKR
jgi:KUP system potassium uptake protein